MAYLTILKETINQNLKLDGNRLLGEAGCRDITINGDVVLIKSGHMNIREGVLGNLFEDKKGYKKNNDWIVFAENKILICEMKTVEPREYKKQLDNGRCLVNFILEKIWLNDQIHFAIDKIMVKYVLFSTVASKRTTNGKPRATKFEDRIQFFELSCGSIYNINDF